MNDRKLKFRFRKGWIDLWWFADDYHSPKRKGRGYWQILGHIFQDSMLETVFSLGRYCGKDFVNMFVFLDFRRRLVFSPFLKWWLGGNVEKK